MSSVSIITDSFLEHQNSEFLKKLQPLYSLRNIIRYNPRHRIKDESVAEHTAFVALIVTELYKIYQFNLEKGLLMALLHDIAEVKVSDVPHDVKQRFPKISEALREAELDALKEWGQFKAGELLEEFEAKETPESLIVNLADAISVQLYVEGELNMGNSTFLDIARLVQQRVILLLKTIPPEMVRPEHGN